MKIIIDERETSLYDKCRQILSSAYYNYNNPTVEKITLSIGDIFITTDEDRHISIIERKTIPDLLASIKDGRYEEQSYRLIHSSGIHSHNIIYIIEGNVHSLQSSSERRLIYSIITSLNHFKGMSVIQTHNVTETAEFILSFSDKIERNFIKKKIPKYISNVYGHPNGKDKIIDVTTVSNPFVSNNDNQTDIDQDVNDSVEVNATEHNPIAEHYASLVKKTKKDNITPLNIGVIFLSQIPFVSSVIATAIMSKYNNSIVALIKDLGDNPLCLDETFALKDDGKRRKIPSNAITNIKLFLHH